MGDEVDPQSSKRAPAAAYDYDGDPRWAEYWSNVLIPPYLASRPDVVDHYKRKFYQRSSYALLLLNFTSHLFCSLLLCNLKKYS
ncbi:hypothetical protein DsansV1_C11g0107051 [Dioscorea sansibarensis]